MKEHSRRNVLRTSATAFVVGIAGCGSGDSTETTTTATTTEKPKASLSVEDQVVEDHVTVTDVTINRPAWVAIWPEAEDGGPKFAESTTKNPIAKAYLDTGTSGEVQAEPGKFASPLSQQLESESTWYAVMHYDKPRNQQFTYPDGDEPIKLEGEMAVQSFTAKPPE